MTPIYILALSWFVVPPTALIADGTMAATSLPAPNLATALEFRGETVDGDLPATYRLPPVASLPAECVAASNESYPLFFPPLTPAQAQRVFQSTMARTPAGPPPDERGDTWRDAVDRFAPVAAGPLPAEARPFTPASPDLDAQLLPAVQRGYTLGQRGALFAARTEFVQVLRRVAQAKDIAASSDEHSQALAAGMRALDEAEDFVPSGLQLEAELDVRATASSHRTAVLPEPPTPVLPHEAVALYHHFVREQLAFAVGGEQAGSMALYGLGRIDAQRADRKDDDVRFVRGAMTMYAAALAACPDNHLAANELGVLECRTGRSSEAVRLFQRTIDLAPTATAYHNLAVAQQRLGWHADARANEQESQRLAVLERARGAVSRRAGVDWVAPEEMARVAQPTTLTPPTTQAVNAPSDSKSPWQRTIEMAKSLHGSGETSQPRWR